MRIRIATRTAAHKVLFENWVEITRTHKTKIDNIAYDEQHRLIERRMNVALQHAPIITIDLIDSCSVRQTGVLVSIVDLVIVVVLSRRIRE